MTKESPLTDSKSTMVEELHRNYRERGLDFALRMWACRDISDLKIVSHTTEKLISEAEQITDYIIKGKEQHKGPGLRDRL